MPPYSGTNSSYLGKIFSKNWAINFNAYVDTVRIDEAKKLLANNALKVYEIADLVGYSNVDYFHKKFKNMWEPVLQNIAKSLLIFENSTMARLQSWASSRKQAHSHDRRWDIQKAHV